MESKISINENEFYGIEAVKEGEVTRLYVDTPTNVKIEVNFERGLAYTTQSMLEGGGVYNKTYILGSAYDGKLSNVNLPKFSYPSPAGGTSPWLFPVFLKQGQLPPENTKYLLLKSKGKYHFFTIGAGQVYISTISRLEYYINVENQFDKKIFIGNYCSGDDPLQPVENCMRDLTLRLFGKRIVNKPSMFDYLGWCSWNAFLQKIDREKIINSAKIISDLGAKWLLIDDGWQNVDAKGQLISFNPNEKIGDLGELISEIKKHVPYVGVWLTIQGYWNGLTKDLPYQKVMGKDRLIPDPKRSFEFFQDYISYLKTEGVDFLKVDNQSGLVTDSYYLGRPVSVSRSIELALHGAACALGMSIIDCMAMNPENMFFFYGSHVIRNSDDYIPNSPDFAKLHAIFNLYNSLLTRYFGIPDYDMFMTHDRYSEFHSLLRVLSGGPVYITDIPGLSRRDIIEKLTLPQGKLALPDSLLTPLGDIVVDPYNEDTPLVGINWANGIALLLIANVKMEGKIRGEVELRQVFPEENLISYDYFEDRVLSTDRISFELNELEFKYFLISPLKEFIPFGLKRVYVMPKGLSCTGEQCVTLDDGEYLLYSQNGMTIEGTKYEGITHINLKRGQKVLINDNKVP
ncbi:alpha-galactosidase [Sulfolobales archaeon HS-7]|nr:alpha-galactosidase [Sulfolobales archaeon HS-7]